jgi:hypothetical protein
MGQERPAKRVAPFGISADASVLADVPITWQNLFASPRLRGIYP